MLLKRFRSPTLTNAQAAWYVALVILALPTAVIVDYVSGPSHSPAETVRRYLEAIRTGDVDEALEYLQLTVVPDPPPDDLGALVGLFGAQSVDANVITESGAWFLHSDAVSTDWDVLDITEVGEDSRYGFEYMDVTLVNVVIGNGDGTASGTFAVSSDQPDRILNGLVPVTFDRGADTFIRAGDRVLEFTVQQPVGFESWTWFQTAYAMLPGIYEFHGSAQEPVAILPGDEPAFISGVVPEADEDAVAAVESELAAYIDACVELGATREVQYCPFASDGEVDTDQGGRVYLDYEAPASWEVVEYPAVAFEAMQNRHGLRLRLHTEEAGLLRLSGTGEGNDGEPVDFTALCHFDTSYLVAYFNHDGSAEIRWDEEYRNDGYGGVGPDSCRGTAA